MTYKLNEELVVKLHEDSIIYAEGVPYIFDTDGKGHFILIKVHENKLSVVEIANSIKELIVKRFKHSPETVVYDAQFLFVKENRKIVPGTKLTIGSYVYTVIKDTKDNVLKLLNSEYQTMIDDESWFCDEDTFYQKYRNLNNKIEWPT